MKNMVRITLLLVMAVLSISCEDEGCNTAIIPSIWLNNSTTNSLLFRVSSSGRYTTKVVGPSQSVNLLADLDAKFTIGVQPEKDYADLMADKESKLRAQLQALTLLGWKEMNELRNELGDLHAQVRRLEKNETAKCSITLSRELDTGHAKASLDRNGHLILECSASSL